MNVDDKVDMIIKSNHHKKIDIVDYENIYDIIDDSIVVEPTTNDDTLGKDLQEIAKQITDINNVDQFSNIRTD